MKRKDFLKNTGLGLIAGLVATRSIAAELNENSTPSTYDELSRDLGFNHLPNTTSNIMKNMVLHRAESRGNANHGWLNSNHTFSFANYHNPERMHFGVLRVLNDDHVEAGMGFGTHPHNDMEIISIPLEGDLEHKDSMGNHGVIRQGDVQIMSAGKGIQHSEFNKNKDKAVKFLQIWLFPKVKGVEPRYDQMTFDPEDRHNVFQQILSPNPEDAGVWIHQDAWFHLGNIDAHQELEYHLKKPSNGVYAFMISGSATINGQRLNHRDGLGVWKVDALEIETTSKAEILLMEVPMQLG